MTAPLCPLGRKTQVAIIENSSFKKNMHKLVQLANSKSPFSSSSVLLFSLSPPDNDALLEPFVPIKSKKQCVIPEKATFGSCDHSKSELTVFLMLFIQVKVYHLKRRSDNWLISYSFHNQWKTTEYRGKTTDFLKKQRYHCLHFVFLFFLPVISEGLDTLFSGLCLHLNTEITLIIMFIFWQNILDIVSSTLFKLLWKQDNCKLS